ncbi:hypothetical protein ACED29_20275 [Shewanella sp. 5S214]|uniref:hypothetical protein n=1 Tax=Shewanella sp. 5S214 TaxID=3229999 RepID=UPI00352E9E34
MGLIKCKVHGESGVVPFVSKRLSDKIAISGIHSFKDFTVLEVIFYDGDDIFCNDKYYLLNDEVPSEIIKNKPILIHNDEDEVNLNTLVGRSFLGGGCCIKCFNNFMKSLTYSK